MNGLQSFHQQIQDRLSASRDRADLRKDQLGLEMAQLTVKQEHFNDVASRVMNEIISPRMKQLAGSFENASPESSGNSPVSRYQFHHTNHFPATVNLAVGLAHDENIEHLTVYYSVSILPVFMEYERHDQLTFGIEALDEPTIVSWVERKLVKFVDTYLQIQSIDQYQHQNLVTDPVCGMRLSKTAAAAQEDYRGQTFYFCVEECQRKFAEQPSRYVAVPE